MINKKVAIIVSITATEFGTLNFLINFTNGYKEYEIIKLIKNGNKHFNIFIKIIFNVSLNKNNTQKIVLKISK